MPVLFPTPPFSHLLMYMPLFI